MKLYKNRDFQFIISILIIAGILRVYQFYDPFLAEKLGLIFSANLIILCWYHFINALECLRLVWKIDQFLAKLPPIEGEEEWG